MRARGHGAAPRSRERRTGRDRGSAHRRGLTAGNCQAAAERPRNRHAFSTDALYNPGAPPPCRPLWRGPRPARRDRRGAEHPAKFLTVMLSQMIREGLVASRRGRDGGYWLAKPPGEISYGSIVRLTRGSLGLLPCASRYAHKTCDHCISEDKCRLHRVMLLVRDETARILDGLSLADSVPAEAALGA